MIAEYLVVFATPSPGGLVVTLTPLTWKTPFGIGVVEEHILGRVGVRFGGLVGYNRRVSHFFFESFYTMINLTFF